MEVVTRLFVDGDLHVVAAKYVFYIAFNITGKTYIK